MERVLTSDGCSLAADWVAPEAPCGVVVVASAMGVPRRIYGALAAYLAERGLAALTFDYRGTGESRPGRLRGFPATLDDWAARDVAAALEFAEARCPGQPLGYLGHSVGGQLLGLAPGRERVAAGLFFACQSGHWRHWSGLARLFMLANWYILIPGLSRLFGYLPMRLMTGGEDVPRGVGLQWARWGRHRQYVLSSELARDGAFARVGAPLCSYALADDTTLAPVRAVAELLSFYSGAAARELRLVRPPELGLRRIGHFGWLKPALRDGLWAPAVDWLLARLNR